VRARPGTVDFRFDRAEAGYRPSKSACIPHQRPVEGKFMSGDSDKTKGKIKEAAGDLTDDDEMKREGKADQASGKVKNAVDDVKDKVTGKD
jgi:uncharacterized protein YjbJ (UPF0337 family)